MSDSDEKDEMHCLFCGKGIKHSGRGTEYVHKNNMRICRPTYATPKLDFS